MSWLVFSYSLPVNQRSSPRVAVWRRLRAIGAVSPKSGVYVLPAREDCTEAFQWLVQEVEQARGEALLMLVEHFEGLSDANLVELFQRARAHDYEALGAEAARFEKSLGGRLRGHPGRLSAAREALEKLRRRHAEITRVDFFRGPAGSRVAARLANIAQAVSPQPQAGGKIAPVAVETYRGKRWVTRPHPHVDRLACVWLIRRFIDSKAAIRYAETPRSDEVAFDMSVGEFGHRGNLCTFETMLEAFGLDDPGLRALAEIVHEIDLRDGRYARPEIAGVDAVLGGWRGFSDAEREAHGIAVFEGLYVALSQVSRPASRAATSSSRPRPRSRAGRRPALAPSRKTGQRRRPARIND